MTDTKQPLYVPIVASSGGVYSAPATEWDGDPVIVEPSLGNQEVGLTPGPGSWLTAETANWLLNSLGAHVTAVADAPAFERKPQAAYNPGNNQLANYLDTSAANNLTDVADPPLMHVSGDGYVLVQQADPSSGTSGRAAFLTWREGQGLQNAGSSDTFPFKIPAFTGGTTLGPATADGHAVVLVADRASANVLACGDANATVYSTDRGENWSAGQALPASANWKYPLCGCVLNGVWYVVDAVDSTVTVNRLSHTTDPSSVAWTAVGGSVGGADTGHTRRLIPGSVNSGTLVMLPASGTHFGYWKLGDSAVTAYFLTGSADNTRTGWKGAWNEQIGLFMIGNFQGDMWTSPDGLNWTQVFTNSASLVVREIVSHGRGFVVSNSAVEWAVDYLAVNFQGTWETRRVLSAYEGNAGPGGAFHLANVAGRWMAGRLIKHTTWLLEWYLGGVNAYDRNSYVGR